MSMALIWADRLEEYLDETAFEKTAVFIDPKSRQSEEQDRKIEEFGNALKQGD